jgi:CheY-like chemotaxis protein
MFNILYVEDMKECFEKTREILGKEYSLDWRWTPFIASKAIEFIEKYDLAIFDVNLFYDPKKSNHEQTKEGLELISMAKKEAERKGIDIPIICVSSDDHEQEALAMGATLFMYKEKFLDSGAKTIDDILRKNNL